MAKTQGHTARTHLPKEITITLSYKDGERFDYKIYGVSPTEITDIHDYVDSGYSYADFDDAIDEVGQRTKEVMANMEKENRSTCESAHDLSEIRSRQSKDKSKGITR